MPTSITLAELRRRGVFVAPHEAVAVAQQLIHAAAPTARAIAPGPPTLETVVLHPDGSVSSGCQSTPAVSELAVLLQRLCDDSGPAVPGALRYAIARALLEVEAAPFDSIEDFSAALSRFETADRHAVVRNLVDRADRPAALVRTSTTDFARMSRRAGGPVQLDRRRPAITPFDLRRELREADRLWYQQVVARSAKPGRRRARGPWITAAVVLASACAGGGAVAVAQYHGLAAPEIRAYVAPSDVAAPAPAPLLSIPEALPDRAGQAEQPVGGRADRDAIPATIGTNGVVAAVRTAGAELPFKSHPRRAVRRPHTRAKQESGLVQALKFKWLRDAFAPRD